MTIKGLIDIYENKRKKYGGEAYRYVSATLQEAKKEHRKSFMGRDHEQSWRSFKGRNLEKLITHIIEEEVKLLGLAVVEGTKIERTQEKNLSEELAKIKRNLLIDYGTFGYHLPDVDIIIYHPITLKVIAVLSSKVTLRERIAQTGYWKMKLTSQKLTQHIHVYFVTLDEDGTLIQQKPAKKGRAIVEIDTDGGYVLSEATIEASSKVKMFDQFISDVKKLAGKFKK